MDVLQSVELIGSDRLEVVALGMAPELFQKVLSWQRVRNLRVLDLDLPGASIGKQQKQKIKNAKLTYLTKGSLNSKFICLRLSLMSLSRAW